MQQVAEKRWAQSKQPIVDQIRQSVNSLAGEPSTARIIGANAERASGSTDGRSVSAFSWRSWAPGC